jgi:hypothetical protein
MMMKKMSSQFLLHLMKKMQMFDALQIMVVVKRMFLLRMTRKNLMTVDHHHLHIVNIRSGN